jgi:hypothetical protein
MNITIDSKELKDLEKRFDNRSSKMKKVFGNIIKKAVLTVERFAKLYSPVRTGRLRASIITTEMSTMSATVEPTVFYAPFVHARIPFMFAARQDSLSDIEDIVKDEVKEALK